jgi:Tat protein secretion system quality control protein TatD with DNase activity
VALWKDYSRQTPNVLNNSNNIRQSSEVPRGLIIMAENTINDAISDDVIWQVGICDAHCHPTDIMASVESIGSMKAKVLTVMSTRAQDQHLVAEAATKYALQDKAGINDGSYIVPAFGWHPWFSHQLYDDTANEADVSVDEHYKGVLTPSPDDTNFLDALPKPKALSSFLEETEKRLLEHPLALVGEIGLDRAFRLPVPESVEAKRRGHEHEDGDYTPGSREGRPLSPYRVSMDHQKVILKAQFQLAAKHKRPVSVHSVQAHGVVFDLLQSLWAGHERPSKSKKKRRKSVAHAHWDEENTEEKPIPYPPRICMHSYSGPVDPLTQFLATTVPADVYFSFSEVVNFSNASSAKVTEVIKAVPADRILIESDVHCAGERMDGLLKKIVVRVCEIKGWSLKDGAQQLRSNWEMFVFGNRLCLG